MLIKFLNRLVDIEQLLQRDPVSIMIGPSLIENPITKERYPAIWLSMDKIEISFADKKIIKRDIIDLVCEDSEQCFEMLELICEKYKKDFSIFNIEDYMDNLKKENASMNLSLKEIEKVVIN